MSNDGESISDKNVEEIQSSLHSNAVQLGRIEERSTRIETKVDRIEENTMENRQEIDILQSKVKRNTTIINGLIVGLTTVVLWAAEKVSFLT